MTEDKAKVALQVEEYRRLSKLRRATSKLKTDVSQQSDTVTVTGGIVVVRSVPKKARQTLAQAGGASKVFGKSSISIPEFRKPTLRK